MRKLPSLEDYEIAITNKQLIKAKELVNGHPIKVNDNLVRYVGGFCVVFPYEVVDKKYAVRCWFVNVAQAQKRSRLIAEELHRINLPYFVKFQYIEDGLATNEGVQPIVLMDWVDAKPLKSYVSTHISEPMILGQLAENFKMMVSDLHQHNISHGDLQHGNIMVSQKGEIILVDYDSIYVPSLDGYDDDIKGLVGYQHPARWRNQKVTPKADYFSELIIYTSLRALSVKSQLWYDLNIENTETFLFTEEDLKSNGSAPIFRILEDNRELKQLTIAIKIALQKNSIDELLPLEETIIPFEEKISNKLMAKWQLSNNVPTPTNDTRAINAIRGKWENNNNLPKKPDYNIEAITNKW